jgi:hypothetical protein
MSYQIVKVHFEGDKKRYRVMKFDSTNIVISERLFNSMEDAVAYKDRMEVKDESI